MEKLSNDAEVRVNTESKKSHNQSKADIVSCSEKNVSIRGVKHRHYLKLFSAANVLVCIQIQIFFCLNVTFIFQVCSGQ